MLLLKEYKINWLKLLLCSAAILVLSILMSAGNCGTQAAVVLYEMIVSMVVAIYSSHIIFDDSNLEILLTGRMPFANVVFNRYFMYISMILLLGILQYGISLTFYAKYAFAVFAALISTSFILSGISLVSAIVFKSTGASTVITAILIGVMGSMQNLLSHHLVPEWLHYINLYETSFFYGTKYWLSNRLILLCAAFVFWIISYALLHSRKFEYV